MFILKYCRSPNNLNYWLIKSDRINTLRKQYDAFLEDDKKRKDRNQFILGRLEEMRSSSALVKIHHKEIPPVNNYYPSSRGMPNYLTSRIEEKLEPFRNPTNIQIDCLTQQFEPSILREISKKYILIPKLQSCFSSSENYQNPLTENADTDWKSKYNILNELKKSEKETTHDNINVIFEEQHKTIPTQGSLNEEDDKINENITLKDNVQNYNANTANYDAQSNKSNEDQVIDEHLDLKPLKNGNENIPQIENFNKDNIFHSSEYNENNQYTTPVETVRKMEASQQQVTADNTEINVNTDVDNDIKNDAPKDLKNTDKKEKNTEDNNYKEKSDQEFFDNDSIMQQNKAEEYFAQDIKENNIANTEQTNIREFSNNEEIHTSGELQEGVVTYKETEPEVNNIENYESNEAPVISNEIANTEVSELENEQNVMFYGTENPEKQYGYQENVDAVGYATENENYTDDQNQYAYHGESQQEQPYTSEVNEHEESSERYDPNYEQQYAENNYGNVTDVPQYDNQQYEVDSSYQTNQDPLASNVNYEEVHPNNENYEHMPSDNTEISYQNQEGNVYNYEDGNYESQQYVTNEQQEYSTTNPNQQEQYVAEQEYTQQQEYPYTEQETIKDMEAGLDSEEGYIDNQNTLLTDNVENTIIPDGSPVETESSLKAS